MQINDPLEIKSILEKYKTVAVIGISDKPSRPSYQVAEYLKNAGYTILPVNPKYDEVLGVKCYPDLKSIPVKVDIVDIFRRPEHIMPIVEESIEIGAKAIWMQLDIVNEEAAEHAIKHGLKAVMNRCIKIEHRKLAN